MPEPVCPSGHDTWEKSFIPAKPKTTLRNRLFRVCAYCRVSTDNDAQLSSFELQQAHYRQLADQRPNWSLRHIYADEGISGVSLKNRTAFNDMIAACEKGEYDLIVTKSVSRFARNLVDCITLVRRLKNLDPPVGVFFETDNLNTIEESSEFMLTFLASFAQEESVKKREAMIWSLSQRFKDCQLLAPPLLGYDRQRDAAGRYIKYAPLVVNKAEADVVRFIFDAYLYGWSQAEIAAFLTDIGCRTKTGSTGWNSGSVSYILSNERYMGDILTWKTFTADMFNHKRKKNRQDMDQYHYRGQHEAIISREKFEMVQTLLENRKHSMRGGLPPLHVIDDGVFRGFVPINHHWINDDPGLYYDLSNSVSRPRREIRLLKRSFSLFDLKGYQVVRSQFTQARYEGPAVTIGIDKITFNLFCVRVFCDVGHIQLLLHPSQRKIAIRPCDKGDVHCIKWRPAGDMSLYAKVLRCQHFGTALFRMMEWDPNYLYKIRGTWVQRERKQIIVYNLEDAVSAVPLPQAGGARPRRAELYAEAWEYSFGNEFYDHVRENDIFYMGQSAAWQADRPSVPAPGIEQYRTPAGCELQALADKLKRKDGVENAGAGQIGPDILSDHA